VSFGLLVLSLFMALTTFSRIPHGFYEHQMREYFSQFGTISKLRLARNRRTGASKHFAFIEFESDEVAKIVANTMDNYLMFGHILKCKYAPQESLHPDLWKGANKRFKRVPYTMLEKKALEAPKTAKQWEKKNAKEQKKREQKAEKMKLLGYEMKLPKLKDPGEVLEQRNAEGPRENPPKMYVHETHS
jgi:nucleolar protein 15